MPRDLTYQWNCTACGAANAEDRWRCNYCGWLRRRTAITVVCIAIGLAAAIAAYVLL